MKKIVLIFILFIHAGMAFSQQDMAFSMYMFNPTFVNPAAAGYLDRAHLSGIFRYQWAGLEGAPRSGNVSFHSPLKNKNMALGATIKYDKLGLISNVGLDVNYAYRIPIAAGTRLSLGLMGSIFNFSDNRIKGKVNQDLDASLTNVSTFAPNFGAGLFLFNKRYFIGASVPHLLEIKLNPNGQLNRDLFSRVYNHYFFSAGYVFGKDEGIKFKPTAFYKFAQNTTPNLDINANILLQERFWIGVGYRVGGDVLDANGTYEQFTGIRGESLIGMFKMLVNQKFEIGYAYDYPLQRLRNATSGSHEFFLGMNFGGTVGERFVSPRYVNYF